ncbi:Ldh family oxidoreductase [Candidatus Gottesmanbacteria bacterium]|nr:Ldh family oxidoreductase [Candidatus Gottesmanbacteria bacterium]
MKIQISDLRQLILSSLRKKYAEEDAQSMTEVLLFGQLSGKTSHGIVRLFVGNSSILSQNPTSKPQITTQSELSSIITGYGNPGMLVGQIAVKEVIQIAKKKGIGLVGTNGTNTSSGCLSYYLEKIALENLIGIIMAQSPPSTPAYGGIEPLFGTNPISFGIPSKPRPLIFDMATSAISFGAMLKAKTLNQKLPDNVAIDKHGNPTTDPEEAMKGATLPFDNSYKGAGLAMMVEILSGLWTGADFSGLNNKGGWGNLFIAFNPKIFMSENEFKDKVSLLLEKMRSSKTKTGEKVRIPGERTLDTRDASLKCGWIEIEDHLFQELQNTGVK